MGKRKRDNKVNTEGGGPNPVEEKRQTRNKKELTTSLANKETFVNVELKAACSSQKKPPRAVVKAGKGRKGVNDSTAKAAAHQSKEEKKAFSWSSAQETIALSELVKLTNVDAGESLDKIRVDWEQLAAAVGERLDYNLTRNQMYEKARRLKERYIRMGRVDSFKNEDDEKMYKLSQQIWGTLGAIRLHLEEEHNLRSGNLEKKFSDVDNIHKDDSLPDDAKVDAPGVTVEKETTPKKHGKDPVSHSEPKQGITAAHVQANPDLDLASRSKINAIQGDTQKTFEVFHAEHQALLKELEKSCTTVLQDMQVKVLSMMNTVRGNQFPCIGGGNFIAQIPLSWDKMVDNCLSSSTNKPAAFENLYEQWQQQRLQELKLTSMKLHLMLEDCKMEQEKLEKQMLKFK